MNRAGGVVATRDGQSVVLHYGSVAGELAICRSRAGIAVRTDLSIAEITGESDRLDELLSEIDDDPGPHLGRITYREDVLWCRSDRRQLLAVSVSSQDQIDAAARTLFAKSLDSLRIELGHLTALSVIGPRAADLLAATTAAVPEESSSVPALCSGQSVILVCEAGDRFLLLTANSQADTALSALLDLGDAEGASLVGMDAVRLSAASRRH